jgi:hypothetical protein
MIRAFPEKVDAFFDAGKRSQFLFVEQIHANSLPHVCASLIAICSSVYKLHAKIAARIPSPTWERVAREARRVRGYNV